MPSHAQDAYHLHRTARESPWKGGNLIAISSHHFCFCATLTPPRPASAPVKMHRSGATSPALPAQQCGSGAAWRRVFVQGRLARYVAMGMLCTTTEYVQCMRLSRRYCEIPRACLKIQRVKHDGKLVEKLGKTRWPVSGVWTVLTRLLRSHVFTLD